MPPGAELQKGVQHGSNAARRILVNYIRFVIFLTDNG